MARKPRNNYARFTPKTYGIDPSRGKGIPAGKKPAGATTSGIASGLTFSGANLVTGSENASTTYVDGKEVTPTNATLTTPQPSTAASNYLSPEEQAKAREALDMDMPPEPVKEQSWIGALFDTSDTFDPETGAPNTGDLNLWGGEFLFDGFLRGFQYGIDRLNQVTVAGLSGLPGGTRTLTWDEANNVSFGQQVVANAGVSAGKVRRGEGNFFDAVALGGLPGIGAIVAGQLDPNTPIQQAGWDISKEEDRKVFNEGWEKFFSGGSDFAFAFADPTLFVGWGAKVARLKYLDRLIDTPEKMQKAVNEITSAQAIVDNNLVLRFGEEAVRSGQKTVADLDDFDNLKIADSARFLYDVTRRGEDGKKVVSLSELRKHRVIKRATNNDALSAAFYNADSFEEASLIMRHAWGDTTAGKGLMDLRPDLYAEIIDGERSIVRQMIAADPEKQTQIIEQFSRKMDNYDRELEWLKKNNADDPDLVNKLDFVRTKKNEAAEKWLAAENFDSVPVVRTSEEMELARKRIEYLKEKDKFLAAAIDEARESPTGLAGAFRGSTAGFASNTVVGRAVGKSRMRRAKAAAETEAVRGAAQLRRYEKAMGVDTVSGTRFWQVDEFGNSGIRRAVRVWRYLGMEAPAGVVHIAGIGAQESTREVAAMLNSIRMYSGKGRVIQNIAEDGTVTTRTIGGLAAKEDMLTRYQNALLLGGDEGRDAAANALRQIEEQVTNEMGEFYNFGKANIDSVFASIDKSRQSLKRDILERGFWVDEKSNENLAPYLETHLQGAEISAPWRQIEKRIMQQQKIALKGGMRGATTKTSEVVGQYTGDVMSTFQDLWRPAVLLRLGYTQRNVAEGLFRSMAFQFSLAPLALAGKQVALSAGNVGRSTRYGSAGGRGVVGEAVKSAERGLPMPSRYLKWRDTQVEAANTHITQNTNVMSIARKKLAEASEPWRVAEKKRLDAVATRLSGENMTLRKSGAEGLTDEQVQMKIAANSAALQDTYAALSDLSGIKGLVDDLPESLLAVENNLRYFESSIQPMLRVQRDMLDNDLAGALLFRQQTMAKRRVYQGQGNVADHETLRGIFMSYAEREAFDPSDPYVEIALANLSADHTMRQAAALRMSTVEKAFTSEVTRYYVAVKPGDPGYFDGLATMLNQWQNSSVGQMIIRDIADGTVPDTQIAARVAAFMRDTPEGREISAFVTRGNINAAPGGIKFDPYMDRLSEAQKKAFESGKPLKDEMDEAYRKLDEARTSGRATARLEKSYESKIKKYNDYLEKNSITKEIQGGFVVPLLSIEDAMSYGVDMVKRYRQLTADSPDLQRYLAGTNLPVSSRDPNAAGKAVEGFVGANARKADGSGYVLHDVIGNSAEEVAPKKFMDTVRSVTAVGFKWLGTIPEDNFVRAPFYGRRFSKLSKELTDDFLAQNTARGIDTLTIKQVNQIRDTAHRRALKDTKDWLYTIDRRTLLGEYGETIFPFISATQNSVTTVGRLAWKDPRIPALMLMVWNAPDRAGIADENGNMRFTLPLQWVPEPIRKKFGLDTMQDIVFNKDQFNIVLPQSGFAGYVPTPSPIVAVGFSEMMKHGIFGVKANAPDLLVSVLGTENADQFWEGFKSYIYGSDKDLSGMSTEFLSLDKALPPWMQKAYQMIEGAGSSSAYTSWYDKIFQTEMLKWQGGLRDEQPTPEEITSKTDWFYMLRIAANLTAFTPPGFTSEMQPVLDNVRKIYETTPNLNDANKKIYDQYGSAVKDLTKISTTESVAGLSATPESLRFAEENEGMISRIATRLAPSDSLNVLGIFSTDSTVEYDPSISATQQITQIPGTSRFYREIRNPVQAATEAKISAGWSQYLKNMDVINGVLQQRGLTSIMQSGAKDLLETKRIMVDRLRNDPRYDAWYGDYSNFSSSRTLDSVMAITEALQTKSFREANMDSPVWQPGGMADQYIAGRERVMAALSTTTDSLQKRAIKEEWQVFRGRLAAMSPEWATKQEKYLAGDDDPENPQMILTPQAEAFAPPVPQYGEPMAPVYEQGGY